MKKFKKITTAFLVLLLPHIAFCQAADQTPRDIRIKHGNTEMETFEVGNPNNAKLAVIFIHGAGGDKNLGVSDTEFGGNFKVLKQLVISNSGVYYSPTMNYDRWESGVATLIRQIRSVSPKVKVVLACFSAGASTCWEIADSKELRPSLAGLIFLTGAQTHENIENADFAAERLPIIFAHGTADPVCPWQMYYEQYNSLRKIDLKYPTLLTLFKGGKHGTPLRLIDWKESLNWILAGGPIRPKSIQ